MTRNAGRAASSPQRHRGSSLLRRADDAGKEHRRKHAVGDRGGPDASDKSVVSNFGAVIGCAEQVPLILDTLETVWASRLERQT